MQPTLATDLALRHLLEAGLKVVEGQDLAAPRRETVLKALTEIFSEASRGSEAMSAGNTLVALEEQPAFESFALLFKYLSPSVSENTMSGRLAETRTTLDDIRKGNPVSPEVKGRVTDLMKGLLQAMLRERRLAKLVAPQDVVLSF